MDTTTQVNNGRMASNNLITTTNAPSTSMSTPESPQDANEPSTSVSMKQCKENEKPRGKRNKSNLGASIRRLITATLSRNQATTSTSAIPASNLVRENSEPKDAPSSDQGRSAKSTKSPQFKGTSYFRSKGEKLSAPEVSKVQALKEDRGSSYASQSRRKYSSHSAPESSNHDNSNDKSSLHNQPASDRISIVKEHNDIELSGRSSFECPLCVLVVNEPFTPLLAGCGHQVCLDCLQRYITTEINHSRLNITCPICSEPLHPNTIKKILQNEALYLKYESFMLRRVLAAEPDARWCPAPDCGYVVLANGCASCPKLVCGKETCNTSFCYHCKQEWHPNQTCSAASMQRNNKMLTIYNITELIEDPSQSSANRRSSRSSQQPTFIRAEDIKECPVCTSRIIKMNDGSCNHMTCSICEAQFCWLCMREISDLHYFSPSGCTFWGKKPWSRKKKLLWQLGMLVGAPICIILIAGIAVPAIVIGIPVWAARKLHNRLERKPFSRYRKNAIITGGVLLSFIVSPIISAVALTIGIPILLGYVYGVVPLSLCRSSGGCLSSTPSLENLQDRFQSVRNLNIQGTDVISIDTALSNKLGDPSIGETSLYMSNISLETNSIGRITQVDRENDSNAALAGSIISQIVDDGYSTRALAGSIISKESGYALIPVEVHNATQIVGPVLRPAAGSATTTSDHVKNPSVAVIATASSDNRVVVSNI